MRMSAGDVRTLREDPAGVTSPGRRLLIRAGYRDAAGAWLPLGRRTLDRVERLGIGSIAQCELPVRELDHEVAAIVPGGTDRWFACGCGYAARPEDARRRPPPAAEPLDPPPMQRVATPGMTSIAAVSEFLGVSPGATAKSIVFDLDGKLGMALVPGDREVNERALAVALAPHAPRLFDDDDFAARPDLPKGYLGPHHPAVDVVVADPAMQAANTWVIGANEPGAHARDAVLGRDFIVDVWADIVAVRDGDPCPLCGAPLFGEPGIVVARGGTVDAAAVVEAVAELHHDAQGLMWPVAIAPFDVHLVVLPGKGDGAPAVRAHADRLYESLRANGDEVLYDDRDASPGVKFADADLIGVPVQMIVGAKSVERGVAERKIRSTGIRDDVPLDAVRG